MSADQVTLPLEFIRSRNLSLRLTETEQTIAQMIRRRNSDNPIPVNLIAFNVGMGERAVRNIVRDLVMEHGLPIGSLSAANKPGFYWIDNPEELKRASERHIHFGIQNIVRGHRLMKRNKSELVGQLEAALEE